MTSPRRFVVIGAGPAGLTAAYELARAGHPPVVVEKEATVGGLARTEQHRGFHFDLGGHRFFTKVPEVKALWREILGDEFLRRPRLSRIYYDGRFFDYPLKPWNALSGLGPWQSVLVAGSYLRWQLFPHRVEDTFEQWVTNRFGRRLFRTFFESYTEKVWGVPCTELKAEWAAQRIKDLSLWTAVRSMFVRPQTTITTLIEEFDYPRLGPGMMWNAAREAVTARGGSVATTSEVTAVERDGMRVHAIVTGGNGAAPERIVGTDFLSSMPLPDLVLRLDPPAPDAVRDAAAHLSHRAFLTVCLVVDAPELFPDNWIYIHDPDVRVGRIQNFKNWSPAMVPDASRTSLGLEYFCNEGDDLWSMPDDELVALGRREVAKIGLARSEDVSDGCVVRVADAYPVYDSSYRDHLGTVRAYVDRLENLQTIGRNGLHRYDNQDHAMVTGMLAVRNALAGESHDLWSVNTEQEYHEEIQTPVDAADALDAAVARVFGKIDRTAFGVAVGAVAGVVLLIATLVLVLRGGDVVGPHLVLLSQYFPGYSVTLGGSFLGLLYGFAAGFGAGWLFALVRNATLFVYGAVLGRRTGAGPFGRFLDAI